MRYFQVVPQSKALVLEVTLNSTKSDLDHERKVRSEIEKNNELLLAVSASLSGQSWLL
jgi:hypothetical protein